VLVELLPLIVEVESPDVEHRVRPRIDVKPI
jgi:hypothetical protein